MMNKMQLSVCNQTGLLVVNRDLELTCEDVLDIEKMLNHVPFISESSHLKYKRFSQNEVAVKNIDTDVMFVFNRFNFEVLEIFVQDLNENDEYISSREDF